MTACYESPSQMEPTLIRDVPELTDLALEVIAGSFHKLVYEVPDNRASQSKSIHFKENHTEYRRWFRFAIGSSFAIKLCESTCYRHFPIPRTLDI